MRPNDYGATWQYLCSLLFSNQVIQPSGTDRVTLCFDLLKLAVGNDAAFSIHKSNAASDLSPAVNPTFLNDFSDATSPLFLMVKMKLKTFTQFVHHVLSQAMQQNEVAIQHLYPLAALKDFVVKNKSFLMEWQLSVVFKIFNEVDQQDSLQVYIMQSTLDLMQELVQVFNFSAPQFFELGQVILVYVEKHPQLALLCIRGATRSYDFCILLTS